MSPVKTLEGNLNGNGIKVGVVASRFNDLVVDSLVRGALTTLNQHGVSDSNVSLIRVAGSFEIPVVVKRLAETGAYDGIITLGALIRGATSHYELICQHVVSGITRISLDTGLPISFGVITCENMEQAMDRAGGKMGNKGAEAALALLETLGVFKLIQSR